MVQVSNLKKSYGDRVLFSELTFQIGSGERCAIVGRNGSGKSTLLKVLCGLEDYDAGDIVIPKGAVVGSLPQQLIFDQPTVLEEALLGLPVSEREEAYRVERILSGLGFSEEDYEASPNALSGGYQLRLALCKVLVGEPDILFLDEPTNYLDIVSIRWLEHFLRSWRGQLLFISHDRTFVDSLCTHIMGLSRGKMRKVKGNLKNYYTLMSFEEENYERSKLKQDKKRAHLQKFVDRFGAKASKAAQAQSKAKALEKMGVMDALQDVVNLSFSFHYKEFPGKQMMRMQDLTFSYNLKASEALIKHLSLDVEKGERIAIIGKNGRGKSTILRLLTEELKAQSGEMTIGDNVAQAYFGQTNIERLQLSNFIEDEIIHAHPNLTYDEVRGACGVMLFSGDDAKKKISVLSGGERSRVLLAKILLTPSNILFLDEPTHHLDMESVEAFIDAVMIYKGAVVLVTHDEALLRRFQPHKMIVCRKNHQDLILGDYDDFLAKGGWHDDLEESSKPKKKTSLTKRERAEKVQERSRLLKPLKRKIQATEKALESMEFKKEALEKEILEMSQGQETGKEMHQSIQRHGEMAKELEALYEVLQNLFDEEECLNKELL